MDRQGARTHDHVAAVDHRCPTKVGLDVPDSVGNFVLCRFAGVADAAAADAFLRRRGLIARKIGAYGLGGSLRITIGTEEEMRLQWMAWPTMRVSNSGSGRISP